MGKDCLVLRLLVVILCAGGPVEKQLMEKAVHDDLACSVCHSIQVLGETTRITGGAG